jgi:two-component system, chemotaxis family, chemotaxis protein CheY
MAKTILLVDDSASVHMVAGDLLREVGYEVIDATSGQEALTKLDVGRVHLIISDLHMPAMDGIELLKQIRRHPSGRFTPVIMLTTETAEERQREGRAAGARAWLAKPFERHALLDAVTKFLPP